MMERVPWQYYHELISLLLLHENPCYSAKRSRAPSCRNPGVTYVLCSSHSSPLFSFLLLLKLFFVCLSTKSLTLWTFLNPLSVWIIQIFLPTQISKFWRSLSFSCMNGAASPRQYDCMWHSETSDGWEERTTDHFVFCTEPGYCLSPRKR
jgi:hypothetical protein